MIIDHPSTSLRNAVGVEEVLDDDASSDGAFSGTMELPNGVGSEVVLPPA